MIAKLDTLENIQVLKDPCVSVIIVSWNTREYLLSCLKSIFEEREAKSWKVIVVDNGSKDGSGIEVKKTFPYVHLIENEENLGFAKATNQGLKKAAGKYVLLLNPDTRVKSEAIERLILFMNASPKVGIAGVQLLNSDGSKQNSIANFPSLATELLNKSLLRWLFPKAFPGKERDWPEPIEVDSVIGACMMVRRKAIEQVGLLDEDYFLFLEETDWCYRMKQAGWKVVHVPEVRIDHFQGKSAGSEKKRARIEYFRSRYHFFKKHKGTQQWLILYAGLVVRLLIESILLTVACVFTLGMMRKWRKKLSLYTYLLWWHVRFCPEEVGLRDRS
ncbi:MAG TPA: glycosyltransferase family 2 protein [Thermodesulfobacteriota bacterium]|nr:glycosyltransferase family 2 protein [Thermodesulfobacteriota bacterium]